MKKLKLQINKQTIYTIIIILCSTTITPKPLLAQKIINHEKQIIQKLYYRKMVTHNKQKIPSFKQQIKNKNINLYKDFYIVYIKNKQIIAFDLVKNKELIEQNTIYKTFILQKTQGTTKKLYFDETNRLIENKNSERLQNTKGNYNKKENNIPTEKENNILSFGSESFQSLKYLLPKIKIEYLRITKYPNKNIIVKLINQDKITYQDIYIKTDLYNENREIIETTSTSHKKNNSVIKANKSITITSEIYSSAFYRIRIYIHCKSGTKKKRIGPYFFVKNKMKIRIKAMPYIKNFDRKSNNKNNNFY